MAEPAVEVVQSEQPECWCCGGSFDESELTRLGAHPEVGLCPDCARWVHRRSRVRQDEGNRGPRARVHRAVGGLRDHVIRSGLHEWPVIGRVLRSLDRHLP